jgi:hypothetical protein
VRVTGHHRFGRFLTDHLGVVGSFDLACPWDQREAWIEQQRRLADERWTYVDAKVAERIAAKDDIFARNFAGEATQVRAQWATLKDECPDGYADAAKIVLDDFAYSVPDEPSGKYDWVRKVVIGSLCAVLWVASWFLLIRALVTGKLPLSAKEAHSELIIDLISSVLSLILSGLTWVVTRRWIARHRA